MVENVRRLLQSDQLFFLRSCSNAIKEHQVWRYKENREGLPLPDEPFDKKDDHTCDALKILIAENPRYAPSLQGESYDEPDII
jgi:phage terminase large subunit